MNRSQLVLASRNRGKLAEMRAFLTDLDVEVRGLDEFPGIPEIVEDGNTFRENGLIKARAVMGYTGLPALADDSGLEVDALGGRPGVYSARFAGKWATDEDNNRKLLSEVAGLSLLRGTLSGAVNLTARYRTVIVLAIPPGLYGSSAIEEIAEGVVEGEITLQPRGQGGFGYDPIFLVPSLGKTFAELSPEERQTYSHRFRALRELKPVLLRYFPSR